VTGSNLYTVDSWAFLLFNKNRKSHDFCTTIGQWSGDRRRKGLNKPKRGYRYTMGQTSFGRMESFIFLYIWNQKCSIQYPVLHKYYTAWFSLDYFFSPKSGKIIYLWKNFISEILKKIINKFEKHPSLKYIYK
jgi:hypothetical protein